MEGDHDKNKQLGKSNGGQAGGSSQITPRLYSTSWSQAVSGKENPNRYINPHPSSISIIFLHSHWQARAHLNLLSRPDRPAVNPSQGCERLAVRRGVKLDDVDHQRSERVTFHHGRRDRRSLISSVRLHDLSSSMEDVSWVSECTLITWLRTTARGYVAMVRYIY